MHLKICNREKMFSSRFSPSTRTFADAVRNSRSPSPADDGAAPVDAAAASPDVPRVAIFEANITDIERDVEFKGRTYRMEGVVTKYGDYLIAANTWGALASGKDKTVENAKAIGGSLVNSLSNRIKSLKHNNIQLIEHLQVFECPQMPTDAHRLPTDAHRCYFFFFKPHRCPQMSTVHIL